MSSRIMMHVAGRVRPLSFGSAGDGSPSLNSSDTPWRGLPLELHTVGSARGRSGEVGAVGAVGDDRGLLVILEGKVELVVRDGQREVRAVGRPGSVSWISSERRRHVVTMTGSARALAVNIPRPWFARIDIDVPPAELVARPPLAPDETLHNLAQCMRTEVAAGAPTGRVFAESLSFALLSYLVDRVPLPAARERVRGRLSDSQCRRLRAYIGDNLGRELGVSELAALVGLSPRQFSTLFGRAFGASPHRYLLSRRLNESRRLLSTGRGIAEVALEVGFSSQSHFTTAFRKAFGTTPRRSLG